MDTEGNLLRNRDLLRYGLWAVLAYTADANRRYYHMTTTWLPHLLTNTLSLLLPDALRRLFSRRKPRNAVEAVMFRMARDNQDYVLYVAPLAVGYILSHPRFNIYKGEWAELRWMGFGLDSIPHTATAAALSALVQDSLKVVADVDDQGTILSRALDTAARRSPLVSLGVLGALTVIWEYGEYRIHKAELAERGSAELINMQWSAADTRKDVMSNLLGWLLAVLVRR